jgi:dTDP-4-dehydrorhamnose 3,5-epimerase
VLSPQAEVLYKCDGFYARESEGGIIYNDPALNIDWQVPADKAIISDKDLVLPTLANCSNTFEFDQ